MKQTLLIGAILFLWTAAHGRSQTKSSAEAAYKFGMQSPLTVVSSNRFMDGGSIKLIIQDVRGEILFVGMPSPLDKTKGMDHIWVVLPRVKEKFLVPISSETERDLISLLSAASKHTFGTDQRPNRETTKDKIYFALDPIAQIISALKARNPEKLETNHPVQQIE